MTKPLELGRIVWVEMADVNGITKVRPAVIVTASDNIHPDHPLEVVAITSRLQQPLPDDHILLPWHPQGHPRTGLNRKCAAVCRWTARVASSQIQDIAGVVRGKELLEILSKIADLPPQITADPP